MLFVVFNIGKKSTMRFNFFFKMFKIWCRFQKWFRKYFGCCRKLHLNWFRQTLTSTEREYLSSRFSMLTNSLKISGTTKTKFFEQKLFQSDQKLLQNYCRLDLDSVMDPLTCWLYISVLTQGFLGIQLTTLFAVSNFFFFFSKMSKIWFTFRKFSKKLKNCFGFLRKYHLNWFC